MTPARGALSPVRNLSPDAFRFSLPCKVSAADDAAVRRLAEAWECSTSHVVRWAIKLMLVEAGKGRRPDDAPL